jgi:hypothetical protein
MLLGIVGKAGAGKDSIADHLIKEYGFEKRSFAGPLKDMMQEFFDMTPDQLHTAQKEDIDMRYGMTPRWILQYLGTEVFRGMYPNIWRDLLVRKYEMAKVLDNNIRVAVSDVRFLNEAEAIKEAGGHVWRVVCINNPKVTTLGGDHQHASEMEQDQIVVDHTFEAEFGDLPGLYAQVDEKMKELS